MAWSLNRLAPNAARTLSEPGMYADGGGLYLRVTKAQSRQWVFLFQWQGRRRELGLGGCNRVSLSKARERAQAVRDLLADGKDPIAESQAKRGIPTFGEMADRWMAGQEVAVRSDKSVARWRRVLGAGGYAEALRPTRVDHVTTEQVLACLRPIWNEKSATATVARGYIERVLDAAKAKGHRTGENPARWKGHLEHLLAPAQKLARGHHAALPYADIPDFMRSLRARGGLAARCLEFTILTAARSGEALGATWGEIDLDAKLWTIPGHRMKAGKAHTVPLSDRAVAIVSALRPEAPDAEALVFAEAGRGLSNMACSMLLRRMKVDVTVHGFRSCLRDWAGDCTDYPRDLLETALAHTLGSVEAAYRRASALEKRRALMSDWARWCDGSGKVANDAGACEAAEASGALSATRRLPA